jgi:hypothetical protein
VLGEEAVNKTIFLTPAKWLHKKTNFKLITEPAFLPNTCYVLGGFLKQILRL